VLKVLPRVIMTRMEREDAAAVLLQHCEATGVDFEDDDVRKWLENVEAVLGTGLDVAGESEKPSRSSRVRGRIAKLGKRLPFRGNKDGR